MDGLKIIFAAFFIIIMQASYAHDNKPLYYATGLCASDEFNCIRVERGQTWEKLFPDERERDLVQRLNRTYNYLWAGKEIAVPKDIKNETIFTLSPFPLHIDDEEKVKQIIIDQEKLAWGAYDEQGDLINWGPLSSGSDKCSDNSSPSCRTMPGIFRVFSKENEKCKSDIFPVGKGGAKMPYCMFFHKGLALHGSDDVPGYRASHGCVRIFNKDAKWLNTEFVELSSERNSFLGTKVIVRALPNARSKS